MSGVIGDLSFPAQPGQMMMARHGPVCETCYLPEADHNQPGYSPLIAVPGVHQSVDSGEAHNAADELPGGRLATRLGEFGMGCNG